MEGNNFHGFFTGLLASLKPHFLAVSIACIGLILIGYGLITSLMPQSSSGDITFETKGVSGEKESKTSAEKGNIVVDVSGSVAKPGVYRLSENARIEDAILAAGGFSEDADVDWTQHSLNLAAKVSDGMKIYIPKVGEETERDKGVIGGGTSVGVVGASTNGLVSINSASSSDLEDLPGIGPVTAGKIIDNRPYGSLDELMSKKAVGNATFEKIKELISL